MNFQDWETVILKNPSKQKGIQKKEIIAKKGDTSIQDEIKKIENDTENFSHIYIPKELSKEIIECRLKLKLTQKDVANKLNVQQNMYCEMENGKALYSNKVKQDINKLERILKIKFLHKK
jgi:ribosome-binding protein aMBF1 (putative translation factor)